MWRADTRGWRRGPSRTRRALTALVALVLAVVLVAVVVASDELLYPDPSEGPIVDGRPAPQPREVTSIYDVMDPSRCLTPDIVADAGTLVPRGTDRRGLGDDIERISSIVEHVRGLEFERAVATRFLGREEVGERAATQFDTGYSSAQEDLDTKVLVALGVLDRGKNLRTIVREAVSEGIAGFYSPETGRLFASAVKGRLEPFDEVILAHELGHALVDQTIGLPRLDHPDPRRGDALLARRALIEGDATLLMQHYAVLALDSAQLATLAGDPGIAEAIEASERTPYFVRRAMSFPYEEGLAFVCDLYTRGAWRTVRRAYGSLPKSTHEILFPHGDPVVPEDPPDPPSPPASWEKAQVSSLGAAELLWLWQAPGGDEPSGPEEGVERVLGWRGGELHVWTKGSRIALAATLVEEEPPGSTTMCSEMKVWHVTAFPRARALPSLSWDRGRDFGSIRCRPGLVRLAIAPTEMLSRRLARLRSEGGS